MWLSIVDATETLQHWQMFTSQLLQRCHSSARQNKKMYCRLPACSLQPKSGDAWITSDSCTFHEESPPLGSHHESSQTPVCVRNRNCQRKLKLQNRVIGKNEIHFGFLAPLSDEERAGSKSGLQLLNGPEPAKETPSLTLGIHSSLASYAPAPARETNVPTIAKGLHWEQGLRGILLPMIGTELLPCPDGTTMKDDGFRFTAKPRKPQSQTRVSIKAAHGECGAEEESWLESQARRVAPLRIGELAKDIQRLLSFHIDTQSCCVCCR